MREKSGIEEEESEGEEEVKEGEDVEAPVAQIVKPVTLLKPTPKKKFLLDDEEDPEL